MTTVVEILVNFLIRTQWFLKINVVDVHIFILSDFPGVYNFFPWSNSFRNIVQMCVCIHSTIEFIIIIIIIIIMSLNMLS